MTAAHTSQEFKQWLANAHRGDICEYARGARLTDDHEQKSEVAQLVWGLGPAVLQRVDESKSAPQYGLVVVDLVQRKLAPRHYSYLAVKR
jgi:hypothetical protein